MPTVSAPSSARPIAMAWPIPREAPVTSAFFLYRSLHMSEYYSNRYERSTPVLRAGGRAREGHDRVLAARIRGREPGTAAGGDGADAAEHLQRVRVEGRAVPRLPRP